MKKEILSTKSSYFSFYNSIGKFDSNWFIRYRDTEFWKRCRYVLFYASIYYQKYEQYQKQFLNKTVFFFGFMFEYQILLKSIHWVKSWKCTIYSSSFSWRQRTSGVYFQVGPYFLLLNRSKQTSLPKLMVLSAMQMFLYWWSFKCFFFLCF